MIECSRLRALPRLTLPIGLRAHTLLRLPNLIAQLSKPGRNLPLGPIRVRIDPPPQPIRRPLNTITQIRLIHLAQRITQLRRRTRLIRRQLTRRISQPLLQMREIIRKLLPIRRQFITLLRSRGHLLWSGFAVLILLPRQRTNPICLRSLLLRNAPRLSRQRIQLARSLLLLRPTQQIRRLAKMLCRPPSLLRTLLPFLRLTILRLPTRTTHRLICSSQTIQRLLYSRIRTSILGSRIRATLRAPLSLL
jgi:hypothetical protein